MAFLGKERDMVERTVVGPEAWVMGTFTIFTVVNACIKTRHCALRIPAMCCLPHLWCAQHSPEASVPGRLLLVTRCVGLDQAVPASVWHHQQLLYLFLKPELILCLFKCLLSSWILNFNLCVGTMGPWDQLLSLVLQFLHMHGNSVCSSNLKNRTFFYI